MAYTVQQLEDLLGNYVTAGGSFRPALAQMLPTLYKMGLWRDLIYEISLSGANGYISLPADTDAVLACTINGFPRNTRSQWHDVKIVGRQATLSGNFGIVDDGFYPTQLELYTVQGVAAGEEEPVTDMTLTALAAGTTTALLEADFGGTVVITVDLVAGGKTALTQEANGDDELVFTHSADFDGIQSITYTDVTVPIDLVDSAFPTSVIASVPTGSGVLRYRRFRTSSKDGSTVVHLLVKRACPSDLSEDTVIHLGDLNAIKHGLLALAAEDNADVPRAQYHWGEAGKLLDQELNAMFGSAKPVLKFCDPAASGVYNNF